MLDLNGVTTGDDDKLFLGLAAVHPHIVDESVTSMRIARYHVCHEEIPHERCDVLLLLCKRRARRFIAVIPN
ncbi:MAG: hypothetical protein DRJ28_07075 [Actinobacteria bacterium]|nr:MAG: hypothetical protein DRJ28_07075 [Actinomycetota bacterium]